MLYDEEIGLDHGPDPLPEKDNWIVGVQDHRQVPDHVDTIVGSSKNPQNVSGPAYSLKKLDLPETVAMANRNAAPCCLLVHHRLNWRHHLVDIGAGVCSSHITKNL